ncbi:MAG: gamma carbonic anhydrase family protein [FCB group bacterium]|nr:gamma carbonic anhydrase family protein [FCB group bacterium]
MVLSFLHKSPSIPSSCYIAKNAFVIGDVTAGERVSVWFGAVVRGDMNYIRIGAGTNIQDNVTVHVTSETAPTIIGERVVVGHNAIIHGCTIEDQCLIGMGAIIMDRVVIGRGSIIGAGTLIPQGSIIPERSLFVGQPGRFKRSVTEAEFHEINESAKLYMDYAEVYKKNEGLK